MARLDPTLFRIAGNHYLTCVITAIPKSFLLLPLLLFFFYSPLLQQVHIKGSVTGTAKKKMLVNSSILDDPTIVTRSLQAESLDKVQVPDKKSDPQFGSEIYTRGKIEYERKTNQYAFMDENNMWDEMAKKHAEICNFLLRPRLQRQHTLYRTGRETETRQNKWWDIFSAENTVAMNPDSNTLITQKSIYGENFLIPDAIVGIAFYTDEILVTGDLESFAGLPGMIPGVAIPRMHTTWYATRLQLVPVTSQELAVPKKGKKYSGANFRTELKDIIKNWGEESQRMQPQIML